VLAEVQLDIKDYFSDHEDEEQRNGRAERHREKAASQKRDMQHDNARIGLAHKLLLFGGQIFALEQIIMNERDAVTDEQGENGKFHFRRDCRKHLPYNVNQQLNKDQEARPRMSAYRRDGGPQLSFLSEGEDKETVNSHKTAVVDYEKGYEEKFGKVFHGVTNLSHRYFENVVKTDCEIFRPV
jgi:hypothetical protein